MIKSVLLLAPLALVAGPALARSPHPLAPPDAAQAIAAPKRDAQGQPLYCYRFTPPTKVVARDLCRTRRDWSAWGVDVDRQ